MNQKYLKNLLVSPLFILIVWPVLSVFILWGVVLYTGQTFGQRAAQKYKWGTPEWKQEVRRLSNGGK